MTIVSRGYSKEGQDAYDRVFGKKRCKIVEDVITDTGEWVVRNENGRVFIQSNCKPWEARLYLGGDFRTDCGKNEAMRYAEGLVRILNGHSTTRK